MKKEKKEDIDQEALDIIISFSNQQEYETIARDTRKVSKYEKIKTVRKSPGYQKFINKFKK